MRHPKRSAVSLAVAQLALLGAGAAHAQSNPEPAPGGSETIVVTGQRAALQSAQRLKQGAEEIIDSVQAEEAGKLPDKSITEVLQRVVGVTIDRNRSRGDPEHFSVEGSGISIRGLLWGASTLNGRETFSAGWPGRELSWGDVPPELMAGVDVYKNPSGEIIEGGVSGVVNLRTALPFDYKDTKGYLSFGDNYVQRSGKHSPNISGLYTTQWDADSGRWGILVDLSTNHTSFRNESLQLDAYYPRTDVVAGQTVWAPKSASFRVNTGDSQRGGLYGALQWKKNDMQSALTYFLSASTQSGTEEGIYSGVENAYKSVISNGVFDSRGVLQSGTYTYPTGGLGANNFTDGGVGFNVTRGWNEQHARTGELAWNFKWNVDDRWSVQNDLQWVHATNDMLGGNIQLGTFVPSMSISTNGTQPVRVGFDQTATDFLANPANYYWNLVMPGMSKADADLYAWKADGRYKFEDPVLRDFRFGMRSTYRVSNHHDASFVSDPNNTAGWRSIAEPWNVMQTKTPGTQPTTTDWQSRTNMAYMSDPRYQTVPVELYDFRNFYNGRVGQVPAIVMPTLGAVKDFPATYSTLLGQYKYQECLDGAKQLNRDPVTSCPAQNYVYDATMQYDLNPHSSVRHSEQTQALYGTLRFGFDDWKFPIEGNASLRVVRTHDVSHGYETFNPQYSSTTPPDLPRFDSVNKPLDVTNSFVEALPSLNLKMNFTDKLQGRLAVARSMNRPGFDKMQEDISLKQNYDSQNHTVTYTGDNTGNVKLKPITANSYDLSLEWYPRDGQSLTAAVFRKDVKDIIMNTVYTRTYNSVGGNPQTFAITGPDNVAKAQVNGLEIAGMTYLDRLTFLADSLPDWAKGFGVSSNFTYIDGKQRLYKEFSNPYCDGGNANTNVSLHLMGCDTNGIPFNNLPLPYMAKTAFNFAFMYDSGPLSARLAYNWHSRILQSVDANGTRGTDGTSADPSRGTPPPQDVGWGLPTWQEAFGQWDGGFTYKVTDKFSLSANATNLNDVTVRQTQEQHIGVMGRAWFYPGRSYSITGRYEF